MAFELPQTPNDAKIDSMLLEFDRDGNLTNCRIKGVLLSNGVAVKDGTKEVINELPQAHKDNYEAYKTAYENAIKTQLGL